MDGAAICRRPAAVQAGTTRIEWTVTFRDRTTEPPIAAAAANANGWTIDQRSGCRCRSSWRAVGRHAALVCGRHAGRRRAEGAVRGVGRRYRSAPAHRRSSTSCTPAPAPTTPFVQGGMLASTWNRGEVLQALTLVRVEGNLAPKTVSIRVDRAAARRPRQGRRPVYNPLVGVSVVEQRWNGRAWKGAVRVGTDRAEGRHLSPPTRAERGLASETGRQRHRPEPVARNPAPGTVPGCTQCVAVALPTAARAGQSSRTSDLEHAARGCRSSRRRPGRRRSPRARP